MTSRAEIMREKMRARRANLKDTTVDSDQDQTPRKNVDDTWGAAVDEEESIDRSTETGSVAGASVEVEDEVKQSEKLVDNLKKRRRRTQKELSKTLQDGESEDVRGQMRDAKRETKQRFLDEANKSATEGEETAASAEPEDSMRSPLRSPVRSPVPRLDIGDGDVDPDEGPSTGASGRVRIATDESPQTSSRTVPKTPRSAREEAQTPRKVSANLATSIRAKLSQKLREAKDKGKDEAYDESRQAERRLKDKRGLGRTTRFDDPHTIREEDMEMEARLERSLAAKDKWKDTLDMASGKKSTLPNEEEAYDFFSRQWESDEEDDKKDKEDGAASQAAAAEQGEGVEPKDEEEGGRVLDEEEETEESKKKKKKKKKKGEKPEEEQPLIPELDLSDDIWQHYMISRAEYKPFHEKMKDESDIYFHPSMRAAPIEQKIYNQEQPRFLEEEGFYVGTRPNVPFINLNQMENRLLKEGNVNQCWFGEDGKLIALPDPLKEVPSRPPIMEDIDPALRTEYKKAVLSDLDGRYIDGSPDNRGHYQLDVDVNTIAFSHHHLFSEEHVLSARITDMYQQYLARNKQKVADFLTEKLKALKSAANHVQDTINKLKADNKSSPVALADQQKRLKDYTDEIKQTRHQRDREMMADRVLSKHIIQMWKDIKSVRTSQKYSNTATKLLIRKEPGGDPAVEEAELNQEIKEQLEELKEEAEEQHQKDMAVYGTKLEEWKKQKHDKKEARQREKRRRRQSRGEGVDELDGDEESDKKILEAEELTKPEKPKMMDINEAKQKIIDRMEEIRRKPGEPRLSYELSHSTTITPAASCPREEQQRRNEINKHKIFVKVLFNDKEVSQTPAKAVGQDFVARFAQIFNIEIMQWPESIKMEIYESVGMNSTLQAVVYAAIPEPNITTENVTLEELQFSSDVIKLHQHTAVGSGLCVDDDGVAMHAILMTSGTFSASVAWAIDEHDSILIPPQAVRGNQMFSAMKGVDAVSAIGVSGMSDMDKLTKWITESHLDPNDPSNAELMCLLKPSGGGAVMPGMRMPDHFRLEQLQEEFNFATDEEINDSRRFRMIELREKEEQSFQNKIIPLFDKEIPDDTFTEYEKNQRQEDHLKRQDAGESHRVAVAKFMQKVREQVMARFRHVQHQKVLSEMVYEDAVPNIGTIIPSLMKIAEPRRPLRPIRKDRKKVTAQNLQGVDVKILVNVVRAFGVPVRAPDVGDAPKPPEGTQKSKIKNIAGEVQVRPFIEVMFQRNTQATSVADGPNPSWNEELALPFRPPNNDFSSANLQTIKDVLYFNIFDECVIDVKEDDRERGTSIHRRIEKRWLGSLKIPFSTIYFNSKIEGTFRVDKPPVLLGYQHDSGKKQTDDGMQVGVGQTNSTYMSLFVTVQPPLTPAEPVREKFDSIEDEKLLHAAETWLFDLEKKFPKREYKSTVIDINGKSVFITRYLRKLKPPDELLEGDASLEEKAERVARYVSMIPFVSDSVVFPGLCDIWSTCDQFLQMLQGDEEEHAVLLANFFLYMGKENVFVLLGSAVPEGPTAYVLTKEQKGWWLWNASTGEHFSHKENYCPVQSIGCIVNESNVYGNIQPNDRPSRVVYDISNTKCWKPFFHKGFPNTGISSVQPSELLYQPTDSSYVQDLTDRIERVLKEKIMEWRSRYITRWNRYCMQSFRRLLPKLEESRGKYNIQQEHSQEMEQILGSYKVCGFPINLPYTEIEPIVDAVFATGVHNYESSEVEYALATYIHPYPNTVLSVWVYVANLVRKR